MDNLRPVLYLSMLLVLFLIWQAWNRDYGPQPVAAPGAQEQVMDRDGVPAPPQDVPDAPVSEAVDAPTEVAPAEPDRRRIRVVTDVLDIEIDTRGGDLVRADLPTYPVSLRTPDQPIRLLDERFRQYVAQSGLIHDRVPGVSGEGRAPSHHAIFQAERDEFRLADGQDELRVPLTWTSEDGVQVTKTYTFRRGDFLINVDHAVRNNSDQPWVGRQYRQIRHGSTPSRESWFLYTFTGVAYHDGRYEKLSLEDMAGKPLDKDVQGGWISIIQHYFLTAWVPFEHEINQFYTRVLGTPARPEHIIGMRSEAQTAAPGEETVFTSRFWVGPKEQAALKAIQPGLELTVDYGMLSFLAKPLFWVLDWIHNVVGNWGWAIIILTILIKLVFYKLSETSYRSMAKMRAVQPKMMQLKDRYGDDKQRMNQALMELYKKEKINPLGGCLPILVQIPVFIALYWVLLESVEMRQAPWILWIQDLSVRDPYFILPILMGVTMIAQYKLNPAPMDPIQQKLMMALPFVFTVFFAFFPAGLVLYWFVNNLLSIAQQWYITRNIEKAGKKG
ncbi:protein translocase subunit YidC [Thioalkalivibrio sulfidiphilus HL-EbGr7]|uniref:Membrane protein insertase YidC n=1 Tax=Thioalkalivibrio sulfidiphilus (strain HL-EbGR7) TaxID=396588 RepID=YIDC_THISH|nr:membrane protein insertase YidC [Thioalkalivibrio sulfidiphilus]B8GRD1.1 RecName: Full=Membrane protein insertase YidC; AltName: Full=Foldase YidC; AltName: Full=Membrane integrase YidC; AltName: Full=Membrane protein YidC [Thioalkalivibrio sulfidiphilus HL-EbGr7]ACL74385.1 protein translocase subunit YidC [Thioalkalivibrio sulfidiphilus HL-EbGr7]